MSLKDYQKQVDVWAMQFETPYWKPLEILARLTEEIGEVARETNHLFGPKKKKGNELERKLGEEFADVIFTIMCYANSQNINLDEYMDKVIIDKCYGRDNDRYKKKGGGK